MRRVDHTGTHELDLPAPLVDDLATALQRIARDAGITPP